MGGYPLAALSVKPVVIPSSLERQAAKQQVQLGNQQIQSNQLDIEAKQRDAQEEQIIQQTAAAHGGSLVDALPELASKISAKKYIGLKKGLEEIAKEHEGKKKLELDNELAQSDQLLGLIQQTKQIQDPQQYQQAWPQIAAQALKIKPELAGHIDPNQPIPPQALDMMAIGLVTQSQLAKMAAQKQAAQKANEDSAAAAAELPGKQAKSALEQKVLAGTSPTGITAAQQLQNQTTKRGQDLAHADNAVRTLSAEEVKQLGLPTGSVAQVNRAGKIDIVSRPNVKMTGANSTALRFFNRMEEASNQLEKVEGEIAKKGLGGQTRLKYAPNWLQTNEGQLYQQAQRSFTEARLRKDSGAAIPETEFENDRKMYFAQPGDTPEVLAQKRAARATAMEGVAFEAGPAFEDYFGEPFVPGSIKARYGTGKPGSGQNKPAGATHTGIGSIDKKKHWLDANNKDLGLAE